MLIVKVDTGNDAFAGDKLKPESMRILRAIADRIESGESFERFRTIFDINGNDVGRAKLNDWEQVS